MEQIDNIDYESDSIAAGFDAAVARIKDIVKEYIDNSEESITRSLPMARAKIELIGESEKYKLSTSVGEALENIQYNFGIDKFHTEDIADEATHSVRNKIESYLDIQVSETLNNLNHVALMFKTKGVSDATKKQAYEHCEINDTPYIFDRLGRKYASLNFIRKLIRGTMVKLHNDLTVKSIRNKGLTQAVIYNSDVDHRNYGEVINVEDYEDLAGKLFHPNTQSLLFEI